MWVKYIVSSVSLFIDIIGKVRAALRDELDNKPYTNQITDWISLIRTVGQIPNREVGLSHVGW